MIPTAPPLSVGKLVVWKWTKATIDDTLTLRIVDATRTAVDRQTHRLPPVILEMIISYLIHHTQSLKACATTCFAWYIVAAPHLHHTVTPRQWNLTVRKDLSPLAALHKLGLLPLVKKVQFRSDKFNRAWVVPKIFDPENLYYFSALVNLQDLTIAELDFPKFTSGIEEYFGRFSPTLRSIALIDTRATSKHLLDFLRLFPKLDDIKIIRYRGTVGAQRMHDTPRTPIQGSLRGKLTLSGFKDPRLLEGIITTFGGMRFTVMDLDDVVGTQLLLDACSETLQTLRLYPENLVYSIPGLAQNINLSRNTALRSLEVRAPLYFSDFSCTLKGFLLTITSPVFYEIVIVFADSHEVHWVEPRGLAKALGEAYKIRNFRAVFYSETVERASAANLRALTSVTQAEVERGSYSFLPCPPVVFSRTLPKYDR